MGVLCKGCGDRLDVGRNVSKFWCGKMHVFEAKKVPGCKLTQAGRGENFIDVSGDSVDTCGNGWANSVIENGVIAFMALCFLERCGGKDLGFVWFCRNHRLFRRENWDSFF